MGRTSIQRYLKLFALYCMVSLLVGLGPFILSIFSQAYGDYLGTRSVEVSDSTASAVATYKFLFDLSSASTLGSISIQFCSNDPFPDSPCTAPDGFDDSQAILASQSGETGFIISPTSTANNIILSRVPAMANSGMVGYTFNKITNPSSSGSYYVRLETFASSDASGSSTEHGGIAFSMNSAVSISTEVPPFIIFCTGLTIPSFNCATASGDYLNFGDFSSATTSHKTSQTLVATNAENGYNISVSGTTMTSGNNTIKAINPIDISRPGVNQFGLNLQANTTPVVGSDPQGPGSGMPTSSYSQPNFYKFKTGDIIASSSTTENYRRYTESYIVNISTDQASGVYATTLTYICLANF